MVSAQIEHVKMERLFLFRQPGIFLVWVFPWNQPACCLLTLLTLYTTSHINVNPYCECEYVYNSDCPLIIPVKSPCFRRRLPLFWAQKALHAHC